MKRRRSQSPTPEAFPPARDSPGHILNVLNDDCIKEIFVRLQNRRDFINAANVCKRFLYVAQNWCSHETLQIGKENEKFPFNPQASVFIIADLHSLANPFLRDFCAYLSTFGERIRNIEWYQNGSCDEEEIMGEIFKAIEHYCGKTLINLAMHGSMKISLTSAFKVLERFEFYHGVLDRFDPPRSLAYLQLTQLNRHFYSAINLVCLEKPFPKLVDVHLGDFSNSMPQTYWFQSFLKHNPQLERLTLIANQHFILQGKHMVRDIAKFASNLESLHLDLFSFDVKDLAGLTKLKCLRIPYGCLKKQDIDALVALKLPINELDISLNTGNTYVAQCISKLEKIKTLTLNIRPVRNRPIDNVIHHLPPLDYLNVRGVDFATAEYIRKSCKNIERVTCA